jgi:CheY-like chemotaxis protein
MEAGRFTVLVVDDSEEDRLFLRHAIAKRPALTLIGELRSGQELLAYLSGKAPYQDASRHPVPDLLLLDAVMPLINVADILLWLKDHPHPGLKIIVITGAFVPHVREQILQLGAHACYEKPVDLVRFDLVIQEIEMRLVRDDFRGKP